MATDRADGIQVCKVLFVLCLLLFTVRFIGLFNPMDGVHHWRQTQTASTIRNFHESGLSILYPQVDWGADGSGFIECEFPIYQYPIAKLYDVFGPHEFIARLVSIAYSALACFYLFVLVRDVSNRSQALWSLAVFLSLHVATFYSRVIMLDILMLAASLGAIWHMLVYSRKGGAFHWGMSLVWLSIACLVKLTPLYLGLPLGYLFYRKYGWSMLRRWDGWLYAGVTVLSLILWYDHAAWLGENGGLSVNLTDKIMNWDLVASWKFWRKILVTRFMYWHMSPAMFWVAATGLVLLVLKRQDRDEALYLYWGAALLVFLLLTPMGNYVHGYYQLPFLPVFAVFSGAVFHRFIGDRFTFRPIPVLLVCVLAFQICWSGWKYADMLRQEVGENHNVELGQLIQKHTPPDSLLFTMTGACPCVLYHSHRKGLVNYRPRAGRIALDAGLADYIVGLYGHFNDYHGPECFEGFVPDEAFIVNSPDYFIIDTSLIPKE